MFVWRFTRGTRKVEWRMEKGLFGLHAINVYYSM